MRKNIAADRTKPHRARRLSEPAAGHRFGAACILKNEHARPTTLGTTGRQDAKNEHARPQHPSGQLASDGKHPGWSIQHESQSDNAGVCHGKRPDRRSVESSGAKDTKNEHARPTAIGSAFIRWKTSGLVQPTRGARKNELMRCRSNNATACHGKRPGRRSVEVSGAKDTKNEHARITHIAESAATIPTQVRSDWNDDKFMIGFLRRTVLE